MTVTYTSLLADTPVVLMAQNTEIDAALPALIRQAQRELVDRLDHDAFKKLLPTTYLVNTVNPWVDLSNTVPDPTLEVRAMRVQLDGQPIPMSRRDIEMLNLTFGTGDQGQPRFYGEDQEPLVMRVFPTPDTEYQIRVTANVRPADLSDTVDENLLTRQYGRVLEMMVLKHGARWMRNQVDEARYEKVVMDALVDANRQIRRRRRDETGVIYNEKANVDGSPVQG